METNAFSATMRRPSKSEAAWPRTEDSLVLGGIWTLRGKGALNRISRIDVGLGSPMEDSSPMVREEVSITSKTNPAKTERSLARDCLRNRAREDSRDFRQKIKIR